MLLAADEDIRCAVDAVLQPFGVRVRHRRACARIRRKHFERRVVRNGAKPDRVGHVRDTIEERDLAIEFGVCQILGQARIDLEHRDVLGFALAQQDVDLGVGHRHVEIEAADARARLPGAQDVDGALSNRDHRVERRRGRRARLRTR